MSRNLELDASTACIHPQSAVSDILFRCDLEFDLFVQKFEAFISVLKRISAVRLVKI